MAIKYRVDLETIDHEEESKDILFSTFVEAGNRGEAIELAKEKQIKERPDLHPSNTWERGQI